MGHESEAAARAHAFGPYQINEQMFAKARPDAIFMHCLPAKRDEEVTDSIMEHERSAIFDQAENRLHAQKALLLMMLT
jgi:ornithine carbamoyltransferase